MPGEDIYAWSVTAATNGNADTSINFAEGQPRASVNNSARAMMAAIAKFRNQVSGAIGTTGTPNAQSFNSGNSYTSIPLNFRIQLFNGTGGQNTGPMTLDMDGIGPVGVVDTTYQPLIGEEFPAGNNAEFRYNGTTWTLFSPCRVATRPAASSDNYIANTVFVQTTAANAASSAAAGKVSKSGDTMTGPLTVNNLVTVADLDCQATLQATGYQTRIGISGPYGGNAYNFYWGGLLLLEAWVDGSHVGTIPAPSDHRIKKDVEDLPSQWDTVKALRPIKYTQADYEIFRADDIERWGFIAHELQETLLPSAASGVKDQPGEIQTPNMYPVIAALTKALQEAMTRIEALEAR